VLSAEVRDTPICDGLFVAQGIEEGPCLRVHFLFDYLLSSLGLGHLVLAVVARTLLHELNVLLFQQLLLFNDVDNTLGQWSLVPISCPVLDNLIADIVGQAKD